MPVVLVFLGSATFVVLFPILNGWVLATIWQWILVPALGLPAISVPAAIGIACIAAVLRKPLQPKDEDSTKLIVSAFANLGLALLIAWCAKQFI